jgi:hypothetical protein
MGRKRRACARAGRVSAVVALAAAALFARERLGTHGAVSPGSSEAGARRSTSASAGLASRVPTPAVADASDADEAVVSSPAADEAVVSSPTADEVATRAGARVARLSAADAARRYGFARNASITATFATIEVADMLRNWIEHAVFVARLPNVAVIALDEATLSKCANGAFFSRARRAEKTNDARLRSGSPARSLTCLDASPAFEDADALRVDAKSRRDSPLIGHRENKKVFNQIGIVKTRVIRALLNANLHVLMSDVDVVWLRDPSEYFRSGQARRAHVAVSSDCVFGFEPGRPATDAFGQKPSPNNAEFNTGVLLLRPAKATMALVERWTASQLALMENHDMNDQTHFNKAVNDFGGREELANGAYERDDDADAELATIVFGAGGGDDHEASEASLLTPDHALFPNEHERGLRPRYYETRADPNAAATNLSTGDASGVARVALLPTGLFSNGHTFFVSRVAERSGVSPFAVHNTYQYSGTAGKIARFRENGLWAVDDAAYFGVAEDERFDDDDDETLGDARRFLLLTYDVPGALADPAPSVSTPKGGTPVTHVDLIRYQVNRVRDGLALASALNRTLILPPLLSTCDRWFNLLPNCTQGDARFPMIAPLDHVFLVFALDAFGGGGRYVEHGFLTNRARFLTRRRERRVGENGDATTRGGDDDRPSPGFGPVARLEFLADDASRASRGSRGSHGSHGTDEALSSRASRRENDKSFRVPFRVPEDFVSVPGYVPALDPATKRAVAATKRGSPRHFSAAFGSVASEVVATLGVGGVGLEAARLLVVENVRPGAFAGFGDADENAAFHERMTPLVHEWCCRENGTVPHLPTPYGEEERYAYARE